MNLRSEGDRDARFSSYVEGLASVVGNADRIGPLRDYCTGLILPGERKSVEPMAAKTAPARTAPQHQSLLHFVGVAAWPGGRGWGAAWIQTPAAGLPVAYRLYLPKDWVDDDARRSKAGVPSDISFKTKPEIALEQIRWACEAGLPRGVALMDGGYGSDSRLRAGMTALGVTYVAGVQPKALVWPSGSGPRRQGKLNNKGRRDEPGLMSIKEVALGLPKRAWRTIRWREGSADWLSSRFARVRVRVGHSQTVSELISQEWLLIEWPEGEAEPTKYWLSTLPANISFRELVDFAKLRWRIERDYQELKQEVGLGHYEGRGWRGFHHHATMCIAAYGFLISERETIPPSRPRTATLFQTPVLPDGYRPRGSSLAA